MRSDDMQPMVGLTLPIETNATQPHAHGSAGALLRMIRLSRAETDDISLFIAPGRLQAARRLLVAGLFGRMLLPETPPSNDN